MLPGVLTASKARCAKVGPLLLRGQLTTRCWRSDFRIQKIFTAPRQKAVPAASGLPAPLPTTRAQLVGLSALPAFPARSACRPAPAPAAPQGHARRLACIGAAIPCP